MDSALTAAIAVKEGYELIAVHFNYGQRTEAKELECFRLIADDLNAAATYELDLHFIGQIGGSALTDDAIDVPTGGIEEGIPVTYVPYRNGIFLSTAAAVAEKYGASAIFIGAVEEDSSGYPDCREAFLNSIETTINLGTKDDTNLEIKAPLVHLKKEEIVAEAAKLGVKLEHTWSCYQSGEKACGVCDSCRLRLKGFEKAGLKDPIPYQ